MRPSSAHSASSADVPRRIFRGFILSGFSSLLPHWTNQSQGKRLKPSHPRISNLLAVGSALGFLTALFLSAGDWLPSMQRRLTFAAPNGGFATVRGMVKIESKIQPRSVAVNFYSRRGGPAAPPKPTTPVNELEN